MKLNHEFIGTFNTAHQMHVGRSYQRHTVLNAKPEKTAAELKELQELTTLLLPYSDTPPEAAPTAPSIREQRAAQAESQKGVVLNRQKLADASLSGFQELQVHRQSIALGKLLLVPFSFLSAQQKSELSKLKAALIRYVGLAGEAGKDSDFRVAR